MNFWRITEKYNTMPTFWLIWLSGNSAYAIRLWNHCYYWWWCCHWQQHCCHHHLCTVILATLLKRKTLYLTYIWAYFCHWCSLSNLGIWHICGIWEVYCWWHIYGSSLLNLTCILLFCIHLCSNVGSHVDYSISTVWHTSAMWQVYLFSGICQYVKDMYTSILVTFGWLQWVHMRYILT